MKYTATIWAFLLLFAVQTTQAQTDVTVREINAIPQAGIDAVAALGAAVTEADIVTHIQSPLLGTQVRFTSVVLSDPRYSGLSSFNESVGGPSRIHFFVRDVSAATDGPAGNDLQVVDGNYTSTGSIGLFVGDVITMVGDLAYFGTSFQFSPQSIEVVGTIGDQGLPDTILDPVTVTIDQMNVSTGDFLIRANWDNLNDLNQQYVRIEGVQVWQSANRSDSRPNWAVRDIATGAIIQNADVSLAYRNDRSEYPAEFFASNDFVAPPPGAVVDLQGFAIFGNDWDPYDIGDPADALYKIVPWTPADLIVTQSPPNISDLTGPDGVVGNSAATVTATVVAHQTGFLTSVSAFYSSSANATDTTEVAGVNTANDTWSFEIPAQGDGDFVSWLVKASDTQGAEATSATQSYRVLFAGISAVKDIQETQSGGAGDSPFKGATLDMDLVVTVQSDPANAGTSSSHLVVVQDSDSPWSGISLKNSGAPLAGLVPGDMIKITSATVTERFGLTQLTDYTFESVSTGGAAYDPVVVSTDLLIDLDIAESLESMFVRVEDVVVISTNADAPGGPFGEFEVSSDGTADNAVRVDDQSRGLSYDGNDPATLFAVWERLEFVQGTLWYSFNDFKIEPGTISDIGPVTNVAVDDEALPNTTELHQNYPNPFNPTTSIRFDVGVTGPVALEVYDTLGRVVQTLVQEQRAAGTYEAHFDASTLSSGLYLYRLTTADQTISRRMMLIK